MTILATIPASAIVQVLPSVLNAGGSSLVMNGLQIHRGSPRIPVGSVLSFASAAAVGAYFGTASQAFAQATVYFQGFNGCTQLPGALLTANWPEANSSAWLQSGPINQLTIAQVQAITGTLTITVDGYPRTWSVNLAGASSYTAAAGLIAAGLNTSPPSEATSASSGASIAPVTSTFTGTIADELLTVTSAPSNVLVAGTILTGTGVTSGTKILDQLSGTAGGTGTYSVSIAQDVASASLTGTYGVLTLAGSNASGTFSIGQTISGGTTTAGTAIYQLGTGTGAAGTYYVSPSQTASAFTAVGSATNVAVTFDAVSGAFVITSGAFGASSLIAFASGSAAAPLLMTQATGAIISQGGVAMTPAAFMNSIVQISQNWATFFTVLDPDDGNGNANKLAFAQWTSTTDNRYAYLVADADITATQSTAATTSLGYLVGSRGQNLNGTIPLYDPSSAGASSLLPAFVAGWAASLNFDATNGRTTLAFRSQAGVGCWSD